MSRSRTTAHPSRLWPEAVVSHFKNTYDSNNHHIPLSAVLFLFFLNRTISCFCVNTVSCPVAHSSVTANTFLYLYIHVCKKNKKQSKVLLFLYEKFKNHIYVYVYIYLYIHIYVLYCVLSNQIGDMSIFYLEIGGF